MISELLSRFFHHAPSPVPSDLAYAAAMHESGDLVRRMREAAQSPDAVRSLMASIWLQRHNVPVITTVYEAVQEVTSPMGGTAARAPPLKGPPK